MKIPVATTFRNLVSDNPKFFFAIMGKNKYMERPIIADKDKLIKIIRK
jgi:hypothetical protein